MNYFTATGLRLQSIDGGPRVAGNRQRVGRNRRATSPERRATNYKAVAWALKQMAGLSSRGKSTKTVVPAASA